MISKFIEKSDAEALAVIMISGHERETSYPPDDLGHESDRSSRQLGLQVKITELIDRHKTQYQQSGRSKSENLMSGFVQKIWPEIRDDYRQMTHYLEEKLKEALRGRHIDAEVSSRVKENASITKTLERRQTGLLDHGGKGFSSYQHILREMHDLSGLRVVLMTREDLDAAKELIERLFDKQKPPAHFDPNREVGQFWKKPWFGAYETHNHRVQLADGERASLGAGYQYSGITFEIQLTTFSDNLYNKLAHDLLYKADPGLVTAQEEMVIDVSHGLARCFELCMRIVSPKLHRDTDDRRVGTVANVNEYTGKEFRIAQSVVEEFEKNLHDRSESDHTATLLRFVNPDASF